MNQLLADNRVSTLRAYLQGRLCDRYDEREAGNLVNALFDAFHGWSRAELVLRSNDRLGESELLRYHFALKRMIQGEPLQYVLGHAWFMGMKLHSSPAALIPRPETEELVRLVISNNTLPAPTLLDVGTGSGCIAVALKKQLPQASVTAIDVSEAALALASMNANAIGADIQLRLADFLNTSDLGRFDIVVSNPPYIPIRELPTMAKHVIDHEPHVALFTPDEDPLIFYRRLMELTPTLLNPGGRVFCEIHENLANDLLQLAGKYTIHQPEIHKDFQDKHRMMTWRSKP
ncbi:MAG: peptide chain release factor N(5)-glutamine methyltransferase [Flavobacteriales bacterium]|jgi:release factor glutamine methyltransferase